MKWRAFLAVALLASRAAAADPDPGPHHTEARRLKERGDAFMDSHAYPDAYALYHQAYETEAQPALVYNMARALQGMGNYPEALARLEEFARVAPPDVKAKVPALAELVDEVRAHVTTLTVRCNVSSARVVVQGRVVGDGGGGTWRVQSGKALVDISADGYVPFTQSYELPGGAALTVDAILSSREATVPIRVIVMPVGALVRMDRVTLGVAPVESSVAAGSHLLEASRDGYVTKSFSIELAAGHARRVDVELEKTPITHRWWFWASASAVLLGGAALTIALLTERSPDQGRAFSPSRITGP